LPEIFFKKMQNLYPDEKLFGSPLQHQNGMVSYQQELEQAMMQFCTEQLQLYIPSDKLFPCQA
jgi:spore photoproduct lyase